MRSQAMRIGKVIAALLVLVGVAAVALPFLVDANHFRPMLEEKLSAALGRRVQIGNLRVAIFEGGIRASQLAIADDPKFAPEPFLTAEVLHVGVDLRRLIFERVLHVESATLDGAHLRLRQGAADTWNFATIGQATNEAPTAAVRAPSSPTTPSTDSPLEISVAAIRLANARVTIALPRATHELDKVAVTVRTPLSTQAVPFEATAQFGAATLGLNGTYTPGDSSLDTKLDITSLDVAPFTTLQGLLTFHGTVRKQGATVAVNGPATIERLKLSSRGAVSTRPVAIDLKLTHTTTTQQGKLARTTLKLGAAVASLQAAYDLRTTPARVDATLGAQQLPMSDVLAFLPVVDVEMPTGATLEGGTLTFGLSARGPADQLQSSGSVTLAKTALSNYDLGSKLRIIQEIAALPPGNSTAIEQASVDFHHNPITGTNVRKLSILAPGLGQLDGTGTVSAEHALDFRMVAVVKTGGLVAIALRQRGETTTVPFFIQGTSANPQFKADVKAVANEKLQQVLNNPEGAIKSARDIVDTAKGIINIFRKKPNQ
jgi:AsmA protein